MYLFDARMELAVDQAVEAKSQVWDPQEHFEYPNADTYIQIYIYWPLLP